MNTSAIIRDWLKTHGYDGLHDPQAQCGCSLEDGVCPCSLVSESCVAGHNDPERPAGVGYRIVAGKE